MEPYQVRDEKQFLQSRHYTAWELIKSYWQSDQRASAYFFYSVIVIMTIALVGFDVVFTYWYNYFYNALQAYDVHTTTRLLVVFFILAAFFIVLQVYRYYVTQIFSLRWRRWLTGQLLGRWLEKRGYYYLENFDEKTDNPDQRIQEDAATIVTHTLDLSVGLISAVTTFPAFVYILWTLSGILTIPLGSYGTLHLPGYLVWVCILYNIVGTIITFKIGKPLVALNFEQQRREASFRFAAIDLRSHSEPVALYNGEHHQRTILDRLFGNVLQNWYAIILRQKLLLWFTGGFNQTAVVLPLLVALPNYFDKIFLLGGLMQSIKAFSSVQDSLAYLINSYTQIANWRAICARLTSFLNHIHDAEVKAEKENHLIVKENDAKEIAAEKVTIKTPQDQWLLKNITEKFVHGKNYLIKGESGIGKSTFIRTIAGIWPFTSGEVILPKHERIMYLPQKPYMPIGTLAEAILFPDKHNPELQKHLEQALRACNLEQFVPRLHETATWSEQLSPGEQQRIAFARVLLHKPNWVFLDESTSMLDLANEKQLYEVLKKELPNCSVVSVGHRPTLDAYHDHIVDMTKYSVKPQLA